MDYSQGNPFEGVFDRQAQERQQALQQQREEINNERKLHAQRLLANKQGGELAKVLSVINPNLSVLGTVLDTTAGFAKQAYNALDEMSTKLSKVSASAKLLGVSIEGLEGASEMHKDILEAQTAWRAFIEEVETGIGKLYGIVQQGDSIAGKDNKELLKDSMLTNFGMMFAGVSTAINPLSGLGTIAGIVKQEQIYEELDKRKDKEKEVNDKLQDYADSLGGVINADISLVKQLVNIEDNLTATQNELLGYASSGVNNLAGAGVNNEVDQNRWTSKMLGITEGIFRNMNGSVNFDDIYDDVLSYFISGETEGLNKYGYGLTEESFYGYAHKYANMNLTSTKYRDDKMIETRFNFFDMWTSSTDDLKESMYDLGYEVKNNTNAIQKWQMLETVSGISTDKGRSSYKDYFAVDQNGNDITDKLFGTETERFNADIRENIKKLGDTSNMTLDQILTSAGMKLPTLNRINDEKSFESVVASNINGGASSIGNQPMTLDQLVASNSQRTLDDVVKNIHVNITTSDNLKAEVVEIASKQLWDTVQDSFSGGNVAKGILSLPGKILGMN